MNKKGEEKKIAIEINYKHLETLASRMKRNAMENEKRERKKEKASVSLEMPSFFFRFNWPFNYPPIEFLESRKMRSILNRGRTMYHGFNFDFIVRWVTKGRSA